MLSRYHRQMLVPGIGDAGQQRMRAAHALIVGCGALGTHLADALARAGVGTLTLVDRDIVELTNLQRQVLFDEADVEAGTPKAAAAKARLACINSECTVNAHVDDFNARNAERLSEGAHIILDGLDNFETRYLLNDLAVDRRLPYIYGGAVATGGVTMAVLPRANVQTSKRPNVQRPQVNTSTEQNARVVMWGDDRATPCLRCVFPEAPPPGSSPTCDTAGVLGPIVAMIAALQAAQALKLLTGNIDALDRSLVSIDLWTNELRRFDIAGALRDDCPCCGQGNLEFLCGDRAGGTTSLCGRNAVQIMPAAGEAALDLQRMAATLAPHGAFACTKFLLRGEFAAERGADGQAIELTLFPNGRAIIKGVAQPEAARSLYARYIGA